MKKQSLNERLEKSNTTAGKLSEALGYISELEAALKDIYLQAQCLDYTSEEYRGTQITGVIEELGIELDA